MPNEAEAGPPIRHHYVPRSYLAPFTREGTTERGRIWVYGREPMHPPTCESLRDVAFEPNLYSAPDENGNPSPELERDLARHIERPFFAWRRGVVCARRGQAPAMLERMTQQERDTVARYVLYQHLRTPAQRLFAARLADVSTYTFWNDPGNLPAFQEYWRWESPRARSPLPRHELELDFYAWLAAKRLRIRRELEANPHLWLRPIHRFVRPLVPVVAEARAWRLVELPRDVAVESPLFTSDNPVVLARPRSEPAPGVAPGWDVDLGGGWNEPGVEMTLALSPRHALMIAADPSALTLADDPARFAASVRVRTARHALQHVYARDDDPRITELLGATTVPDVVFEVGGELVPGTVDVRELDRRAQRAGVTTIRVRFAG